MAAERGRRQGQHRGCQRCTAHLLWHVLPFVAERQISQGRRRAGAAKHNGFAGNEGGAEPPACADARRQVRARRGGAGSGCRPLQYKLLQAAGCAAGIQAAADQLVGLDVLVCWQRFSRHVDYHYAAHVPGMALQVRLEGAQERPRLGAVRRQNKELQLRTQGCEAAADEGGAAQPARAARGSRMSRKGSVGVAGEPPAATNGGRAYRSAWLRGARQRRMRSSGSESNVGASGGTGGAAAASLLEELMPDGWPGGRAADAAVAAAAAHPA